ncbi:MAG: hypothetical protein ACR2PV_06490 [Gammaproteobacteria bacterium]
MINARRRKGRKRLAA